MNASIGIYSPEGRWKFWVSMSPLGEGQGEGQMWIG